MEVGNLPNIDTCLLNLTVQWWAWVTMVNLDKILGHCQKRLRTTALGGQFKIFAYEIKILFYGI